MTVLAVQRSMSLLPEQISITVVLGTPLICYRRYMDMFLSCSIDCIVMFIPSFFASIISVGRPFVNMKLVPKEIPHKCQAGDCDRNWFICKQVQSGRFLPFGYECCSSSAPILSDRLLLSPRLRLLFLSSVESRDSIAPDSFARSHQERIQLAGQDQLIVDDVPMLLQVIHPHPFILPDGAVLVIWQHKGRNQVVTTLSIAFLQIEYNRLLLCSFRAILGTISEERRRQYGSCNTYSSCRRIR